MIEHENYDPDLRVEKLKINDCDVDLVLCKHTKENAAKIGAELKKGDVVLLEAPGRERSKRDRENQAFTKLVSKSMNREQAQAFVDESKNSDAGAIICELIGSDVKLNFIDVCVEDEEYELVKESNAAREKLADACFDSTSMDEARESLLYATGLFAKSNIARNKLLAHDIEQATLENPGKNIKVLLGSLHYDVASQLDDSKNVNVEQLRSGMDHFKKMVVDFSEGKLPEEEVTNRALFDTLLLCYQVKDPTGAIKGADYQAIARALDHIDMQFRIDTVGKARDTHVRRFLKSFVDVVEHN